LIAGTLYSSKRIITKQLANVEVLLDVIGRYKPTTVLTVPFIISEFLNSDKLKPLNCVKNYIASGTVMSPSLAEKLLPYIPNGRILNAYGSTENASVVTLSENKFDSIGKLGANFQMKIVDDNGQNLGVNEVGEICTKPPIPWLVRRANKSFPKQTLIKSRDFRDTTEMKSKLKPLMSMDGSKWATWDI
jgi:acyl-coenzyme A synthetase/AMP-(fatty) acid ligase